VTIVARWVSFSSRYGNMLITRQFVGMAAGSFQRSGGNAAGQ
jgi:hypothetical protein